jgi:hypothetical protein
VSWLLYGHRTTQRSQASAAEVIRSIESLYTSTLQMCTTASPSCARSPRTCKRPLSPVVGYGDDRVSLLQSGTQHVLFDLARVEASAIVYEQGSRRLRLPGLHFASCHPGEDCWITENKLGIEPAPPPVRQSSWPSHPVRSFGGQEVLPTSRHTANRPLRPRPHMDIQGRQGSHIRTSISPLLLCWR